VEKFQSDKQFRTWNYSVSHSRLLLRHNNNPEHPKNIDIIFTAVFYMEIPDYFIGISIEEPTQEEIGFLTLKTDQIKTRLSIKFFKLKSGDSEIRYFIGAAFCKIYENSLPALESSLNHEPYGKAGKLIYSA
jgi:hypothetical protein